MSHSAWQAAEQAVFFCQLCHHSSQSLDKLTVVGDHILCFDDEK